MDDLTQEDMITSEDVANIMLTRGRRVDLHNYICNHPDELAKGVLIAGSIGSGKTQRAIRIISAAVESGYGVLVFDPSRDHSRLVSVLQDTVVLDYQEFIVNPLEPPTGMRLDEWAPTFIQVFSQNYGLKDPSIAILQKAMKKLTSSTPSNEDTPPTLEDLLEEVRQYTPRPRSSETSSHVSVQNRLESLLDSELGRSVNVRNGF
ncbi:MAG: helicase HerA domain-containing protein, partial [Candidatus Thorarchaeota archaeon]